MKNLRNIKNVCLAILLFQTTTSIAQNTAWSTTNPIGIGTATVAGGYKLHVNGPTRFSNSSSPGNYMAMTLPAGENGLSFIQGSTSNADIRFSGTILRLLATTGTVSPGTLNGISIKTNGFVGIGNDSPSYRLNVNDSTNSDYGSWISAKSKGPALFVRRDNTGITTGNTTYTVTQRHALAVQDLSSDSTAGSAIFLAAYGITSEAKNHGVRSFVTPQSATAVLRGIYSTFSTPVTITNAYGITHEDDTSHPVVNSVAIRGYSRAQQSAIGVMGVATSNNTAYGIYGTASGTTAYAGYFAGNVFATGTYTTSDAKLKQNVKPLSNALDIINRLTPRSYHYKNTEEYRGLNLPAGEKYGLIAQELEIVLPGLVKTTINPEILDAEGKVVSKRIEFKAVDYTSIIPFLIAGIKEQQKQIEDLKEQLNALSNDQHITGLGSTDISSNVKSVLYQNQPNPFTESTIIRYQLKGVRSEASLMIFDMTGAIVKTIELNIHNSNAEVLIRTGDLKPGMYIYSLITDKNEADTKRMIIGK